MNKVHKYTNHTNHTNNLDQGFDNNKILYLNTSEPQKIVLGFYNGKRTYIFTKNISNGEISNELLKSISQFLKKRKIYLGLVNAICIYVGPGSYTALRVGVACANTLSYCLDIPIFGIKKLDQFNQKTIQHIQAKFKHNSRFTKPINAYYQQVLT